MSSSTISSDALRDCLAELQPVQLKGMELLQASRPTIGLLPDTADIPRETLRDAVVELIAYTDGCSRAIQRLRDVPPVPIGFPVVEWAL